MGWVQVHVALQWRAFSTVSKYINVYYWDDVQNLAKKCNIHTK